MEQETIKVSKETKEMFEFVKNILKDLEWTDLTDEEAMKLILWTFLAVISTEENNGNEHHSCECGHCHCKH